MDFRTVLAPLQWSNSTVQTYLVGGWLCFINNESLRLYQALVQNLTSQATHRWEFVKFDVKYFVKKLEAIRSGARHRFIFVIQVYCFLRDQEASGFQSAGRLDAHLKAIHRDLMDSNAAYSILEDQVSQKGAPPGGRNSCPHCWLKGHHKSKESCPFKAFAQSIARKCQVLVRNKMNDGTDLENAVREVLANPPTG
jgi:hypothetical protein